jgi:imidazolonepropionase-like amidohydrolase
VNKTWLIIGMSLVFLILTFGLIDKLKGTDTSSDISSITTLDFDGFRTRVGSAPKQKKADSESFKIIATSTPTASELLAIVNGTVIAGTGMDPISNGAVIIRGDRIVAIGRPIDLSLPPQARVINVAGKTIMPGVINAHVHYSFDPVARRNFLVKGVTAVCDLGTSLRTMPNFERQYTRQNESAARGLKAGPIITVPGGYPGTLYGFSWNYDVSTPTEAQAAVQDLLDRGADVIKIALEPGHPQQPWPVLSPDEVQAIVITAHAHDVPVRAHVRQSAMLDIALDAGVDVIEHIPLPFCLEAELQQMLEEDTLHLAKQPQLQAQLTRMAEKGIVLVPTLAANSCVIQRLPELKPEDKRATNDFLLEVVGFFRDRGGVIALGNDYGYPGVNQHMPLREMELLLAAGLTSMEVIEAGTKHAAQVCGHGDDLGTLEPGKLADLIVIEGNPLADIQAMNRIMIVIKGGAIAYARSNYEAPAR